MVSDNSPKIDGVATRAKLFAQLDKMDIAHQTVNHDAVFTVEEGREIKKQMPGMHSKNLFLRDKKNVLTLAVAAAETKVDLVGLGRRIGAKGRLSFGKPDLMQATLGVIPGAVTPFALINPSAQTLNNLVLDEALLDGDPLWFHPLENTASTAISPAALLKFVEILGFHPQIVNLAAPEGA